MMRVLNHSSTHTIAIGVENIGAIPVTSDVGAGRTGTVGLIPPSVESTLFLLCGIGYRKIDERRTILYTPNPLRIHSFINDREELARVFGGEMVPVWSNFTFKSHSDSCRESDRPGPR